MKAGVIDQDYTGNVHVLLSNSSPKPLQIATGDRITQLIFYRISTPSVQQTSTLSEPTRGESGFGSTGVSNAVIREVKDGAPPNILDHKDSDPTTPTVHDSANIILQIDGIKPYNIWLSNDPFHNRLTIMVDVKGQHPTLGMQFTKTTTGHRLQLTNILPSTPAAKIPKWRSTLRWSYILEIDGTPINNIEDVEKAIANARTEQRFKTQCIFATEQRYGTHPVEGSLNLYFDQMNAFSKHTYEADKEYNATKPITPNPWFDYIETDGESTNLADIIRVAENTILHPVLLTNAYMTPQMTPN